jgi:purine-binding chemotaxis protein CheW
VTHPAQYLSFTVADEEYAVEILHVREITQFDRLTRVPSAPACVRGVMNLRGAVVPVVDLAVKLGLPESRVTKLTCVVIVDVVVGDERTQMGILADTVNQVIELGAADIEPPPPFGTRVRIEYLVGLGRVDGGFLVILDADKLLAIDDLVTTPWSESDGSATATEAACGAAEPAEGAEEEERADGLMEPA